AQADVAVAAHHAQQEPDLLLAFIVAPQFAAHVMIRYGITQPVPGPSQNAYVLGAQAGLLVEFAGHRLHGSYAVLDAPLRKLPCVFPDALAPENLVFLVHENDADIRTVAFAIQHGATSVVNSIQLPSIIRTNRNPYHARQPVPSEHPEGSPRRGGGRQ